MMSVGRCGQFEGTQENYANGKANAAAATPKFDWCQ